MGGNYLIGENYPGLGAVICFVIGCAFAYAQPPNWIAWMIGAFVISAMGFLQSYNMHQRKRDTTGLQ
jgi:hypothetical protein